MDQPIVYDIARNQRDLQQIQQLQLENLPDALTEEEAHHQGFVTIRHDLDLLEEMNQPYPHIVARVNDKIIGYTLVMLRSMADRIPLLIPMFREIDQTYFADQLLGAGSYVVMGQVCIEKAFRGRGVFAGLYREMGQQLSENFDYIITEVSVRNQRSMRAHEKVGFKRIKQYSAGGDDWVILLLEI